MSSLNAKKTAANHCAFAPTPTVSRSGTFSSLRDTWFRRPNGENALMDYVS